MEVTLKTAGTVVVFWHRCLCHLMLGHRHGHRWQSEPSDNPTSQQFENPTIQPLNHPFSFGGESAGMSAITELPDPGVGAGARRPWPGHSPQGVSSGSVSTFLHSPQWNSFSSFSCAFTWVENTGRHRHRGDDGQGQGSAG